MAQESVEGNIAVQLDTLHRRCAPSKNAFIGRAAASRFAPLLADESMAASRRASGART